MSDEERKRECYKLNRLELADMALDEMKEANKKFVGRCPDGRKDCIADQQLPSCWDCSFYRKFWANRVR